MIVKTNNKLYSVKFSHIQKEIDTSYRKFGININIKAKQHITYCRVKDLANKELVCETYSACSFLDKFDKHTGKSVAFIKALNSMSSGRMIRNEDRKCFEHAFNSEYGNTIEEHDDEDYSNRVQKYAFDSACSVFKKVSGYSLDKSNQECDCDKECDCED